MKKSVENQEVSFGKLSKKQIDQAVKGISKSENEKKRELKKDRLTLSATVSFISESDSEIAKEYREFLSLKKCANKAERKRVITWVESRLEHSVRHLFVKRGDETDEVMVEYGKYIPCRPNGTPYKDMIDAIADLKKVYALRIAKRNDIARQLRNAHSKVLATGKYTAYHAELLLKSYTECAPAKICDRTFHGDIIVRR